MWLQCGNCRGLLHVLKGFFFFFHVKSRFRENIWCFLLRKRLCLVRPRIAIMLQHLSTIQLIFALKNRSNGRLPEIKNKGQFQNFSSKSGPGRLREVVGYKRFQIQWFDWETFSILKNWSRRKNYLFQVAQAQVVDYERRWQPEVRL